MRNLSALSIIAVMAGTGVHASTLFSDDFENNTVGTNKTPTGWSVTDGTVDIVGPALFAAICAANEGNCIDLDGSSGNAGKMTSVASFDLLSGVDYTLSFDYTWNAFNQQIPNTMTFGVGGFSDMLTTDGIRSSSQVPYTELSLSFVGDGSTGSIFFDHQGSDNGGIVVDNINFSSNVVTPPPSAVPLPAGLPLILGALGTLGFLRRRTTKS